MSQFWNLCYNLLFPLIVTLLRLLSLRSAKVKEGFEGRKALWMRLSSALKYRDWHKALIWFHVASAGEYLQAQPVMELCVRDGNECVLTFNSVNAQKWIERTRGSKLKQGILFEDYLPLDFPFNMRRLLGMIQPSCLVYVSYDLWPNLVWESGKQNIPQYVISGIVHEDSFRAKYRWGRSFYASMYKEMTGIYTVSKSDQQRVQTSLSQSQASNMEIEVMGDTRCDSVLERRDASTPLELPECIKEGFVFIAGSTWRPDEDCIYSVLKEALQSHPELKIILAPHEPVSEYLEHAEQFFAGIPMMRWSELQSQSTGDSPEFRILLVDKIGVLYSLYQFGSAAYIGGAFTTGVHNTLEPTVYGLPVLFGPKHNNSMEALRLVQENLAFCTPDSQSFKTRFLHLLNHPHECESLGKQACLMIESQRGASDYAFHKISKSWK